MRQCQTPPTVLIIDDNELFRSRTGAALRQAGYAVQEAENGLDALRQLRRGERPQLILLDLLMPVMDGWQLRDRMTDDPELRSIPVVITTAVASDYRQENSLQAIAYLPKPYSTRAAVETVEALCPLEMPWFRMYAGTEMPVGVG